MHPSQRSLLSSAPIDFEALLRSEEKIREATKARNTHITYASAWRAFCFWCETAGLSALPAAPPTVKNFATWCLEQGYRIGTVALRLSGIRHYHRDAGFISPVSPEIRRYLENAKRHFREEPGGKRAITIELLRKMLNRCPDNVIGVWNRAMLLLTFSAGWRRTEIIGLRYSDIRFVFSGLELWLRSSKTDQVGEGRLVGIQPGEHSGS